MVDCEIRILVRWPVQAGFDAISKDHALRDHGLLAFLCGSSRCWDNYPTSCLSAVSTIVAQSETFLGLTVQRPTMKIGDSAQVGSHVFWRQSHLQNR